MMRILIVTSSYLPKRGGLETVVRELATRMQQKGHDVVIVSSRFPRTLPAQEVIDNIPVKRFQFLDPEWGQMTAGRMRLWLAGFFFFPYTLVGLFLLIRQFRPDVVNVHYPHNQTPFVWLLHHLMRFRLVVSLHGGDVDGEPHKSRFRRWRFEAIVDRAGCVTACSQDLLDQAVALRPSIAPRAHVVHNGVNASLFLNAQPYAHPRPYVLGVGRLEHHKGFDTLLAAFAQIAPDVPMVDLLIAGEGRERERLQTAASDAGLSQRVHLMGNQSREQVAALMRGAAIIAIPSRREPFGIVALEALAAGRPIIVADIAGLREAVADAEVLWVAPDDSADLADGLAEILRTGDRPTLLETNRSIAARRSWNAVADQYLEHLS